MDCPIEADDDRFLRQLEENHELSVQNHDLKLEYLRVARMMVDMTAAIQAMSEYIRMAEENKDKVDVSPEAVKGRVEGVINDVLGGYTNKSQRDALRGVCDRRDRIDSTTDSAVHGAITRG